MRGASPMAALLASLQESGTDAFHNTVAHINAFSGPVNNGSLERDQGSSMSAVAR
ncbi:hypothetical protein HC752_22915 [Vibrio sp. S9_S30]|uniref:hypothetical protein n=1 Tax=Vibrio sp. S9_S30 TaxID=2720226 RepID=UPI001680E412|nr:hypothetical protein [Vibrio sp. S9_S30]MBD1559793.1 hypothetical protein [Vibrio sp. S9_S30]